MFKNFFRSAGMILLVIIATTTFSQAQTFMGSTSTEFAYPINVLQGRTEHSSCLKFNNLLLAAWDEPSIGGQMIWQVLGTSGLPVCQGTINYASGIREIEVGLLAGSQGKYIVFVAYHEAGVGHSVEQWEWDPTACTMTWLSTTPLSSNPDHSRISMDSHKLYGVVIAWDDKLTMKTILYNSMAGVITSSIIHSLSGPSGAKEVDVAFSHLNTPLMMNYVYLVANASGAWTTIEVSQADYWNEYWSVVPALASGVLDVNPIAGSPTHRIICNIDGPDHGWDNCAYAYTDDLANIKVRIINGVGNTFIVNDASIPGQTAPINTVTNSIPTLSYDQSGLNIMVGWHTTWTTPFESYVAVEILRDGSAMVSPPDYLEIPFNPLAASGAPTLAFSKRNESNGSILYAFFSELNSGGLYDYQHKMHPYGSPTFKREAKHECADEHHHPHKEETKDHGIAAYPNPSQAGFELASIYPIEGSVTVSVTDLTGKSVLNYSGTLNTINQMLRNDSDDLLSGAYIISITGNDIDVNVKYQKM